MGSVPWYSCFEAKIAKSDQIHRRRAFFRAPSEGVQGGCRDGAGMVVGGLMDGSRRVVGGLRFGSGWDPGRFMESSRRVNGG